MIIKLINKTILAFVLMLSYGFAQGQTDTLAFSHKLVLAAYNNQLDSAIKYLRVGAKTDYFDDNGYTALMYAVQNNSEDMVKLLVYNGSKLDQADFFSASALVLAAKSGFFNIAEYLCYQGADVNKPNYDGDLALHFAALYSDFYMTDMLLFYNSNPNYLNKLGNSPLHFAAIGGDTAVINNLLKYKALVSCGNLKKITPIDIAIQYHHNNIVKMFLDLDSANAQNQFQLNKYLSTAIRFANDTAVSMILGLMDQKKIVSSPTTENPISIARQYNQKEYVKLLKTKGYNEGWSPEWNGMFFNSNLVFNPMDRYFDFVLGLAETRYKTDVYLSYGSRFKRKPILIPENDSVSYQFFEKRNLISLGIDRRFYPLAQQLNLFLFAGVELQWHFGSYVGSNRNMDKNFCLAPTAGVNYNYNNLNFHASWKYSNWEINQIPAHWLSIGIGYQWSVVQQPIPFNPEL